MAATATQPIDQLLVLLLSMLHINMSPSINQPIANTYIIAKSIRFTLFTPFVLVLVLDITQIDVCI